MAERFYINCPLALGPMELAGPEAHHLAAVSRLRAGDALCLFNGDGREYPARVVRIVKKSVQVEIVAVESPGCELDFYLEVAAPLPKGDRAQFLVEKLTELGVASFVPLRTRHSVVEPRSGKLGKLHRYVIEASKQCGRNVLMRIGTLTDWDEYCRVGGDDELRIVAHPLAQLTMQQALTTAGAVHSVRCAVGPEGGFTDDEIHLATDQGWRLVGLGSRLLRIETAALTMAVSVSCGVVPKSRSIV
ncbi:MAG: 16S rRNA (uracil(1498)-N(3))-methyltransferase [Gemmataceae bacterium]|nr:16S rRNA (uracil(1498)-N(3))-methyltransferase [Gemmataceae bacterium]MCI0740442.1 16S rRNA (uracil(1498)-N(3))-methyltransferase [Gemmataceae bacterium]